MSGLELDTKRESNCACDCFRPPSDPSGIVRYNSKPWRSYGVVQLFFLFLKINLFWNNNSSFKRKPRVSTEPLEQYL